MKAAPAFDCAACGRRIGKTAGHNLTDDGRVLCGRCLGTRRLHASLYPNCPVAWHDLFDHARGVAGTPSRCGGSPRPVARQDDMSAAETLTRRLVDLAAHGRRPRCGEPGGHELWCSDDADDRAQAARWCAGCVVLTECAAAADEQDERFGAWGGRDRTASPASRRRSA